VLWRAVGRQSRTRHTHRLTTDSLTDHPQSTTTPDKPSINQSVIGRSVGRSVTLACADGRTRCQRARKGGAERIRTHTVCSFVLVGLVCVVCVVCVVYVTCGIVGGRDRRRTRV